MFGITEKLLYFEKNYDSTEHSRINAIMGERTNIEEKMKTERCINFLDHTFYRVSKKKGNRFDQG